ncbi:MAG: Mut7-C RNAse domain-containing protein [Candidatus Sumerlaeia bacterium]
MHYDSKHKPKAFICDNTLGKLARYMILLGYDVARDKRSAREILRDWGGAFVREGRMVLGRSPELAREEAESGRDIFVHIKSPDLTEQLKQVTARFPMDFARTIFTRCTHCNTPLDGPLPREQVIDQLPPLVRDYGSEFMRCPDCDRLYWRGTHTERLESFFRDEVGLDV